MNLETARFNMIEQQIRPWEVLDPAVLELLAAVRREDFVPPARRALAFVDTQVPLLDDEPAGPCMLEPKLEARLLQELSPQRHERVLEVGTGSGFMAALLGHRAAEVLSVECRRELVPAARANLAAAGLVNVTVAEVVAAEVADARAAPIRGAGGFDAILLSGSVAFVPPAVLALLKPGGRLVAIVGEEPVMVARLLTRRGAEAFDDVELFDTVAPRLLGFPERARFVF
jgi:protein-L-isoaspartate(D-aspartate) O-methyltransferase